MKHLNRESQYLSDKDNLANVVNLSKIVVVVDVGLDVEKVQALFEKVWQFNQKREVEVFLNGQICRKLKNLNQQNFQSFMATEIIREEIIDQDECQNCEATKAFYKAINRVSGESKEEQPILVLFFCKDNISYFSKADVQLTTRVLREDTNHFFLFLGVGNNKFRNLRKKLILKFQNTAFIQNTTTVMESSETFTTNVLRAYVPWLKNKGYIC